jgi:hypothetical protein
MTFLIFSAGDMIPQYDADTRARRYFARAMPARIISPHGTGGIHGHAAVCGLLPPSSRRKYEAHGRTASGSSSPGRRRAMPLSRNALASRMIRDYSSRMTDRCREIRPPQSALRIVIL